MTLHGTYEPVTCHHCGQMVSVARPGFPEIAVATRHLLNNCPNYPAPRR